MKSGNSVLRKIQIMKTDRINNARQKVFNKEARNLLVIDAASF